jgi:hypothetical protein
MWSLQKIPLGFLALGFLAGEAFADDKCWIPPLHENAHAEFNPANLRKIDSVDDLPGIIGDLRNHWVVAYHTHSPQSYDNRAIAYSPRSPYILAFTGCPKWQLDLDGFLKLDGEGKPIPIPYPEKPNPECEQVETMQLTYPEERIKLDAYRLPGRNASQKTHPMMHFSQTDVEKGSRCIDCHGSDPQPNFAPYNTWTGFFGSRSREGEDVMRKGSREHRLYQEFVRRVFSDPLEYKRFHDMGWRLDAEKAPQETYPDLPTDSAEELADNKRLRAQLQYHYDRGEIPIRIQHSSTRQPSPELNKMLSVWRGRMIMRRFVDEGDDYQKVKHALMSIALGCETAGDADNPLRITQFLPPGIGPRDPSAKKSQTYEELRKEVDDSQAAALDLVKKESAADNPFSDEKAARYRVVGSPGNSHDRQITQLAYLWRSLGRSTDHWSGSEQPFNFNEGRSGTGPIFQTLLEYNAKCDPEMTKYHSFIQLDPLRGAQPAPEIDFDEEGIDQSEKARRKQTLVSVCLELAKKGSQSEGNPSRSPGSFPPRGADDPSIHW